MIWIYRIELFITFCTIVFIVFNLKNANKDFGLLLSILLATILLFVLGILLQTYFNKLMAAICVLAIPTIPVLLYLFFVLLFIILKPDFK
jgi:undecaprenyl pyrophosphate phosphatase UppP